MRRSGRHLAGIALPINMRDAVAQDRHLAAEDQQLRVEFMRVGRVDQISRHLALERLLITLRPDPRLEKRPVHLRRFPLSSLAQLSASSGRARKKTTAGSKAGRCRWKAGLRQRMTSTTRRSDGSTTTVSLPTTE